jgi:hypothetical protein
LFKDLENDVTFLGMRRPPGDVFEEQGPSKTSHAEPAPPAQKVQTHAELAAP